MRSIFSVLGTFENEVVCKGRQRKREKERGKKDKLKPEYNLPFILKSWEQKGPKTRQISALAYFARSGVWSLNIVKKIS